ERRRCRGSGRSGRSDLRRRYPAAVDPARGRSRGTGSQAGSEAPDPSDASRRRRRPRDARSRQLTLAPEAQGRHGAVMGRLWQIVASRPRLAALAFGFLAATGFQPLGLWPLAMLAMAGFAALLADAPYAKRAVWLGWLFGFAHFTFGNNWIATAFTHQAEMPAVLGWVAVPLLSLYLAVYPALAALGARALAGRGRPWVLAFALAGCWIVAELLRARVFTGYAWNPFAMVLLGPFDRPGLAALSPWMGTYALSGLAVFLSAALAALLRERRYRVTAVVAALLAAGMYWPA